MRSTGVFVICGFVFVFIHIRYIYLLFKTPRFCCNFQGGISGDGQTITLSDPVLCSRDNQFGATDLGGAGIATFFSRHHCNEFCRAEWRVPEHASAYFAAEEGTAMMALFQKLAV